MQVAAAGLALVPRCPVADELAAGRSRLAAARLFP
jgi:hypothetical protein